jgi:hypothetical protein
VTESQAVRRCIVLRQTDIDFRDLKRGEIFCIETSDGSHSAITTEWACALEDAKEDPHHPGQFIVPADQMSFVVGKPSIVNHLLRPVEAPSKVLPKVRSTTGKNH